MSRKTIALLIAAGSMLSASVAWAGDSKIKVIYAPPFQIKIAEPTESYYAPPPPVIVKQSVKVATIVVMPPLYARPRWVEWDPRYSWPNGQWRSGPIYYSGPRYPF